MIKDLAGWGKLKVTSLPNKQICWLYKTNRLIQYLAIIYGESESEVAHLCLTFCDPMDSSLPQSPLSMGFSRQEYWSGLSFPSPGNLPTQVSNPGLSHCRQTLYHLSHQGSLSESESEVAQSCPTLCDPMDGSLPGSAVHGIFPARVLECAIVKAGKCYKDVSC